MAEARRAATWTLLIPGILGLLWAPAAQAITVGELDRAGDSGAAPLIAPDLAPLPFQEALPTAPQSQETVTGHRPFVLTPFDEGPPSRTLICDVTLLSNPDGSCGIPLRFPAGATPEAPSAPAPGVPELLIAPREPAHE